MEKSPLNKMETKETKQKKQRKVSVKNPSFFLYKRYDGVENDDLSPKGSFETEIALRNAYAEALDEGTLKEQLVAFKGRFLEFEVKETKRRITVR